MERGDHRAMPPRHADTSASRARAAVDQAAPVAAHPLEARGLAFLLVLAQRRDQRGDGLGRRREAPAAVALEASPLPMQVQAERVARPAAASSAVRLTTTRPMPGRPSSHLFGDSTIASRSRRPRRSAGRRTRRSHRRSGRRRAVGHLGQRLDRVEQAGAGVDVADDHVADRRIGRKRGIELHGA